jgi:hypothetical protein
LVLYIRVVRHELGIVRKSLGSTHHKNRDSLGSFYNSYSSFTFFLLLCDLFRNH